MGATEDENPVVRGLWHWQPLALDTDGTPLANGERMIEVEPGLWKTEIMIGVENYIAEKLQGLPEFTIELHGEIIGDLQALQEPEAP